VDRSQGSREQLRDLYRSRKGRSRLRRILEPPSLLLHNPHEPRDFPLGRWNLYVGGAGREVDGYVNFDLVQVPGVDVAGDAHQLPFRSGIFQRVECDAVLEHVQSPERVMGELERVLAPGGYLHLVTPFCHPFHEYPRDYRRFTIDGLKELASGLEVIAEGWRTGPTATMLVFTIEYAKLLFPWRAWRVSAHGVLGWLLFPLRYLDLILLNGEQTRRIGNHCYLWLKKPM
jgi:SAM-dependent methyltransferase